MMTSFDLQRSHFAIFHPRGAKTCFIVPQTNFINFHVHEVVTSTCSSLHPAFTLFENIFRIPVCILMISTKCERSFPEDTSGKLLASFARYSRILSRSYSRLVVSHELRFHRSDAQAEQRSTGRHRTFPRNNSPTTMTAESRS